MKPEDILNAIGEVDDAYIKKARKKSLLKALLVFTVIVIVSVIFVVSLMQDDYILLRFNTDASVNTGYVEPEVLIYDKWTSIEQTSYANGEPVSTTEFKHTLYSNHSVIHTENGETTFIVGSSSAALSPKDYLGSRHYTNLYISSYYSTDLIDRIDMVFINSETAYGVLNQQLNCIQFEYFERSDRVERQTLLANGRTPEETVISSRGYSHQNNRISGWQEWDAEYNLLAYAEYTYDGNVQTVTTYLADGTLTGTRVSKYSFGNLKSREYFDADGALIGKEVYRYRVWELFFSLEGFFTLVVILSLAATAGIAVWDDRIKPGDRLIRILRFRSASDTREIVSRMDSLREELEKLLEEMAHVKPEERTEEMQQLSEEIAGLNETLAEILDAKDERRTL